MKSKDLIKILVKHGYALEREGGNHSIYKKGMSKIAVPRHKEIKELLAKQILKEAKIL